MPRPSAERALLLVVVTDRKRCRGDLVEACDAALRGGATAVLLRDRDLPRGKRRALARKLRSITVRYGATLIVHTDAALAREVGADGVHLDSTAGLAEIRAARRIVGRGRLVGISTHSKEEVRRAEAHADYAFLGPVERTRSHPGRPGMGWPWFVVSKNGVRIPLVAVGGVTPRRISRAGIPTDGPRVAAIDGLTAVPDPAAAAGAMLAAQVECGHLLREPVPVAEDERSLVAGFLGRMVGGSDLALGPGDDAVVLRRGGLAVAVDLTIEGIHYDEGAPARAVGFKAAGRALSDLAAVGAEPVGVMVGLAVKSGPGAPARARGLEAGVAASARAAGTRILGGDTKQTGGTETIAVTALGRVEGPPPLPRSGGRPGDILFVTGPLGGSMHGRHLRPRPRIEIGLALRRRGLATACIDISDGLAADLHRLCRASGTGAMVDGWRVPLHPDTRWRGNGALSGALFDGEDYELLFAAPPGKAARIEARGVAGRRVFRIGRLVHRNAGVVVQYAHGLESLPDKGWVHFRAR